MVNYLRFHRERLIMEIQGKQVKRGFQFVHAFFLDNKNQPLQCEVTRVAGGFVYWKVIGEDKSCFYLSVDSFEKSVKNVL